MSYDTDYRQKFEDLDHHIANQDQLKRKANGGNSILFSYAPDEEMLYLKKAQAKYNDSAEFIDVSKLLVQFIDKDGWDAFKNYYHDFQNTPHLVFHSDDPSDDLFNMIIHAIESACANGKIPMLIRTGALFGTGIENVNIMEYPTIMNMRHPLVIFYPSRITDDNLYFLNFKPASQYRCSLVK